MRKEDCKHWVWPKTNVSNLLEVGPLEGYSLEKPLCEASCNISKYYEGCYNPSKCPDFRLRIWWKFWRRWL